MEPLPVGPCQPTIMYRIRRFIAIPLALVAAVVLSVAVHPLIWVGFLVVSIAFVVFRDSRVR